MTGVFGQFTGGVNGSADVANNTQQLCYELTNVTAPGGTATWAIDPTNGELSLTGGTIVNGSYFFECTLTDATNPLCTASVGSLTDVCTYELVFGTPPVNQILCFGSLSTFNWQSICTTSCPGGSTAFLTQQPIEVGFLRSNAVINGGTSGSALSSGSANLLNVMDAAQTPAFQTVNGFERSTGNGGGQNGTNLVYYNVLKVAQTANPNTTKFGCGGLPPVVPAFTTGELVQGELRVRINLTKGVSPASSNNTYRTYYMIGYRTITPGGVVGAWQAASYKSRETNFYGVVTTFGPGTSQYELLSVDFVPAQTNYVEYVFDVPGEYFIRNNGVASGSQACNIPAKQCDGVLTVDFEDAIYGPALSPCADCDGPL